MVLFELLQLARVFLYYLLIEYLWHAFIMPLTNRNGITLHERLALTRPIGLGFVSSPGSPGGEDLYLGDLARGRGLYASLHTQGLITVTGQACLAKELFNLLRFEAQPHIRVLFAHPTVGVIDLVHYSDRAAGLHDADHLLQHHPRLLCVMEDHIGKRGVHGGALQGQGHNVALQQLDVSDAQLGEILPRHLQHSWRVVHGEHPPHLGGDPGSDETRAGADVGHRHIADRAGDGGHPLDYTHVIVGEAHRVPVTRHPLEERLHVLRLYILHGPLTLSLATPSSAPAWRPPRLLQR